MIIKVLGPGCTNCVNLERVTRQAVDALGVNATIEKVTDYPTIAGYGVMATPALVVDEKLVLSGRVPTAAQVRELLTPLARYTPHEPDDRPRLSRRRAIVSSSWSTVAVAHPVPGSHPGAITSR